MTLPHLGSSSTVGRSRPPADGTVLTAARESAIALLTDRFADDTLTVDEFEARLDRLYVATTAAELDTIVRDLAIPGHGAASSPTAPYAGQGTAPDSGCVVAILSESKRTGRWVVPQRLNVQSVLGDALLDLRDAALPSGVYEFDVVGVLGQIKVLVPPGVVVEDAVTSVMSTVRNDAEDDARFPASGTRVRLTGIAVLSEIAVRVALPGDPAARAWKRAKRRRSRR